MVLYGDPKIYAHDEYGEVTVVITDSEPLYRASDVIEIIFGEYKSELNIERVLGFFITANCKNPRPSSFCPRITIDCITESAVRYATMYAKAPGGEKGEAAIEWLKHDVLDAVREEFYSPEAIFMRKYFSEASDKEKFAVAGILNSLIALSKKRG